MTCCISEGPSAAGTLLTRSFRLASSGSSAANAGADNRLAIVTTDPSGPLV